MSDEDRDPFVDDRDLVTGMGGADDGSGSAPLPIPADVPIERLINNDMFADGSTGPVNNDNQPEAPEED